MRRNPFFHSWSHYYRCGAGHHQAGKDWSCRHFTKSEKTIVFNCRDNSQVQVTPLAADLVRVRTSFAKPIPLRTIHGP